MALYFGNDSTHPVGVVQRAEPAQMRVAIERLIATAIVDETPIVDLVLAGAGAGHTFEAALIATQDPAFVGLTLDPTQTVVRVARDNTEAGLAEQIARIIVAEFAGLGANVAKIVIAGAGAGATYMAIVLGSTQASPGGNGQGSACNLSHNLYVDQDNAVPLAQQDGSPCKPYETIEQANDFIASQPVGSWVVHINQGTYFEDLTFPPIRDVEYRAIGFVDHVGNASYTTGAGGTGKLTFTGRFFVALLGLWTATGLAGSDLLIAQNGANIPAQCGIFAFDGTGFAGALGLFSIGATIGAFNAPTLEEFSEHGVIAADQIVKSSAAQGSVVGCTAITVTSVSEGYWATLFETAVTFTGPVGSFRADETAISTFFASGGALAGAATIAYLDDDGGKAVLPFTVGTFANPQPVTLHEALQRIGNVVSVGQTVPIP